METIKRLKNKTFYSYLLFIIYLLVFVTIAFVTPTKDIGFKASAVETLNDNWLLTLEDGQTKTISLPYQIDTVLGQNIRITKALPDAFRYGQTIRLRSSMEEIKIFLNGEQIYDNSPIRHGEILQTPEASAWVLIDIPTDNGGSSIEIDLRSDIPYMSGTLNEIAYGSSSDLIAQLLISQKLGLLIVLLTLGVAVFTFIISFSINRLNIRRVNYLSLFSLTISIWLFSEMDIMQLLIGNSYIVGTISYITLPVSVIAFILFMEEVVLSKYSKYLKSLVLFCLAYLSISTILQSLFGIHYFTSWIYFLLLLSLIVISIVILLFKEAFEKNATARRYLFIVGILMITAFIEVMMFVVGDFNRVSSLSKIGILVFLLLLVVDTLNYLNVLIQKEGENSYLRNIAYKDTLTGGFNRGAFELEIDRLLSLEENNPFRLTMFDLNNLKKINDNYGHETGDQALKFFHKCLAEAFLDNGICYRIGGDEFMVIQHNTSLEIYIEAIRNIKEQMLLKEKEYGFQYGVAFGSDIYTFEQSFGEFKHHVDQIMYEEKSYPKHWDNRLKKPPNRSLIKRLDIYFGGIILICLFNLIHQD